MRLAQTWAVRRWPIGGCERECMFSSKKSLIGDHPPLKKTFLRQPLYPSSSSSSSCVSSAFPHPHPHALSHDRPTMAASTIAQSFVSIMRRGFFGVPSRELGVEGKANISTHQRRRRRESHATMPHNIRSSGSGEITRVLFLPKKLRVLPLFPLEN